MKLHWTRKAFIQKMGSATLALTFFRSKLWASYKSKTAFNIILGRPTAKEIELSFLSEENVSVKIYYGTDKNKLDVETKPIQIGAKDPLVYKLSNLKPNKKYYYKIVSLLDQTSLMDLASFHTQRSVNEPFVFTITADSHLGTPNHCDPELYNLTLLNVGKDNSDLHFSLGDDFRTSKVKNPTYQKIEDLYTRQRQYLGQLCHSVPYFFILGNHELEAKAFDEDPLLPLASWSKAARTKYIINPTPNQFYTGNAEIESDQLARQNYYAFEWGNTLFVTLDVFRYSNISAADEEMREQQKEAKGGGKGGKGGGKEGKGGGGGGDKEGKGGQQNKKGGQQIKKDQWAFTLGNEQYTWLQKTLSESKATFKFVLGHHVMGSCRGAVEWATAFEWGGKTRNGDNQFKKFRPDWDMPIHALFVKYGVTAFIQGHDHLFARQQLDGVTYITCPMSGDPGYNTYNSDAYLSGDKLSNTGHLKFSVLAGKVTMDYIKAVLPKDEVMQGENGHVAYSYQFNANKHA